MNKIKFGKRIKELRCERELKQDDLARVFAVTSATISRWEAGIMEPDFEMLGKISEYFKVSTDFLLGLED